MIKKTLSLFLAFFKIGAFTFGGGYAMIALLENEFVEKKKWITKNEFLDMVAIAESTPGPVAVNSATYIGYKTAGFKGAAVSTLAVCIPSFAVIFCISLFFSLQFFLFIFQTFHVQFIKSISIQYQFFFFVVHTDPLSCFSYHLSYVRPCLSVII